jgi:hypothetical protein
MLDVVLPFENVVDVIAMDWDPITDEMYWAGSYDDEITIRKGKMRPPYYEVLKFYVMLFKNSFEARPYLPCPCLFLKVHIVKSSPSFELGVEYGI